MSIHSDSELSQEMIDMMVDHAIGCSRLYMKPDIDIRFEPYDHRIQLFVISKTEPYELSDIKPRRRNSFDRFPRFSITRVVNHGKISEAGASLAERLAEFAEKAGNPGPYYIRPVRGTLIQDFVWLEILAIEEIAVEVRMRFQLNGGIKGFRPWNLEVK